MSLVSSSQQHSFNSNNPLKADPISSKTSIPTHNNANDDGDLDLYRALQDESSSMERGAPDYSQTGLHTPYPTAFTDAQSEDSPADHSSAAHSPFPQHHSELRANGYATSATPTSEYAAQHPPSARSTGSFPEHVPRQYYAGSSHSGSSGGMAQPPSPSMPLQDRSHQNSQIKSDQDVPIDPSIAASSPSYPPQNGQYSPYPAQHDMQHGYPGHPTGAMYQQPRPDWAGYGQPHGLPHQYAVSGAHTPTSAASAPGARPGQVYSFVPIPGAQQHKRPRRRYEEIERMYKCGWQGCEKAYGTLNHLNAHVTMQSHGTKRTPEEFKEIRKEWKARKKEEENARKAEEDRNRANQPDSQHPGVHAANYQQGDRPHLPPIGYQPGSQVPGQYQQAPPQAGGVQQLQEYGSQPNMSYPAYPASPYGQQPSQQMYSQHNAGAPQPKYEQH
ncbi:hypothetical protein B0O99DRAFT_687497 [Bisporella sp. PMI_857]|nr:hypothetical protein B0O99DRAFT_687497 [Bisporella sp. PMI_857]